MKRPFALSLLLAGSLVALSVLAPVAFAQTVPPTLTLSATGSGDNVLVTVTGSANESVLLSYNQSGVGPTITSLGDTDGNGDFTDTISSGSYGITEGTPVSVYIGGTGGAQSNDVAWPDVTSSSSFTLSANGVVLNVGSSDTITATDAGNGLYVSGNSNPSIANVSVNGSSVTISGNVSGSTTVTLCQTGAASNCPSVYVYVEPSGASLLSLSEGTASVVSGQDLPITLSGGNGSYEVVDNSDSGVIQASISGSVLTLTTGSTSGSASVVVCSTDMTACGVVNATAGSSNSEGITFSNTSPEVATGQSTTVQIYGPSGVQLYVSTNSNPSIVQANLSDSTLTLTGISSGSSSISICASSGACDSLTATVEYLASGGNITLSENQLSLESGQNSTVTVSGGEEPYSLSGGATGVAQTTLNGNSLTIYAVASGTSDVDVCSAGGGCTSLDITVGGVSSSSFSLGQTSLDLAPGQSALVALYGSGSYDVSNDGDTGVASASVDGDNLAVVAIASGDSDVSVCDTSGSCATLSISVSGTVSTPTTTAALATTFTEYLAPGDEDAQVLALQETLAAQGDFSGPETGYYGALTEAAVIKFQAAHGIDQLGVVGPATRAALNALGSSSTVSSSTDISDMSLSQLQSEVQSLESELTQVLNRISQLTSQ